MGKVADRDRGVTFCEAKWNDMAELSNRISKQPDYMFIVRILNFICNTFNV